MLLAGQLPPRDAIYLTRNVILQYEWRSYGSLLISYGVVYGGISCLANGVWIGHTSWDNATM